MDKPEEDLLKILQKLSPEKLKQIKKTLLDKMEVDSTPELPEAVVTEASAPPPAAPTPLDKPEQPKEAAADDVVILLDSDEDEPPPPAKSETPPAPIVTFTMEKLEPLIVKKEIKEESDNKENLPKVKWTQECINTECKRESKSFQVCPRFVLNYYYVSAKPNKDQFICDGCFEEAVLKFEVSWRWNLC